MREKITQVISLPIGMILLTIGILFDRYLADFESKDFLIGFLFGLSIVLNLYYIIVKVKSSKKNI